jgi:hypothetical protein
MATVSDEHGEMFQQDIFQTEKRYIRKWSKNVFADCYRRRRGNTNWRRKGAKGVEELINVDLFCI